MPPVGEQFENGCLLDRIPDNECEGSEHLGGLVLGCLPWSLSLGPGIKPYVGLPAQ